jgi:outer membrane protein assembly factor BamB
MRLATLAVVAVLGLVIRSATACAADETTQYRVNPQHSNSVPDSPVAPPLRLRWQANLGELISNVVVAGGRVFYVRDPGTRPEITALRASDGAVLWSRTWMEDTWGLNGLAVDGGRLFWVRNHSASYPYDVHVEAIDPATGGTIWNRNIGSSYGAGSRPTVANGELYLLASGGGTQLYALRQSDGADRWPPVNVTSGDNSTPSLDDSNVYVSVAGAQTFAVDRATGAERWHYKGCCTGGGGTTTLVFGGRLFAHDGLIHDTASGLVVGSWVSGGFPSWSGSSGVAYAYPSHTLRGFGPSYEVTRWQLELAAYADLAPLFIAGSYAYVAMNGWSPRELTALRLSDGARVWCQLISQPPPGTDLPAPPEVVAAGEGLLFVNNGYGLAAFESGGEPSDCVRSPATSPGPSLELTVGRRSLTVGQRTNVVGRLSGLPDPRGRTIAIEADAWPFDGRFKRVGRGTTGADGAFGLKYAPRRNARLRAQLVDEPRLVSQPVDVYAELRMTVYTRDAGGRHPRLELRVYAGPGAELRRRPVYGYLARGKDPWRRVARGRWQRGRRPAAAAATLRYPHGRLRRGDQWLICTREAQPDAFGRPRAIGPRCGRRTLAR